MPIQSEEDRMDMRGDQLHTLRHMLGINTPHDRVPKPYRNYAAANPGDPEYGELEALGMVEMYLRTGDYDYYRCTEAGKLEAMRSHRAIRLKRSGRVYAKFLDVSDSFPDLTFRQFLTDPYFQRSRSEA